jgi:hypothetical protein
MSPPKKDFGKGQTINRVTLARNRNRNGRRPQAHLTDVELRFCAMRARGISIRQAAAELGLKEATTLS